MSKYAEIFLNGYMGYARYLWHEITHPGPNNYFYWLIVISLFFLALEWSRPWRRDQPRFRKDFWLDAFYMFFNFFLFSLIIYNAVSDVFVHLFNDVIYSVLNIDLSKLNPMYRWPAWAVLATGFVVRDFIQWWVHRLLHRSRWLWEFHKVHHSVEQMGFAAQLRYHWMENVIYRSLEYIPLALLGIGLHDFFLIHIFTLTVGHYNHANITVSGRITAGIVGVLVGIVVAWSMLDLHIFGDISLALKLLVVVSFSITFSLLLGPSMKKIFNSPEMHIWHHAYDLPQDRKYGVNFGLSLALWDYIFGTAYVPSSGRDIRLGFPGIEEFPKDFIHQNMHGYLKK